MGDIQLELYWNHAPKARKAFHGLPMPLSLIYVQTCKNFAELAKRGYYNGTVFHRVIAVSGVWTHLDSSHTGAGLYDSRWRSHWHWTRWNEHLWPKIVRHFTSSLPHNSNSRCSEDEIHRELRFTGAGILAMANSGPNTNGSSLNGVKNPSSHLIQVPNSSSRWRLPRSSMGSTLSSEESALECEWSSG